MVERRSENLFSYDIDARAIESLKALELLYWNEWECACRFQDTVRQCLMMKRIASLRELIDSFMEDELGR